MVAPTTKLSIAAQASNTGKNSVVVNVNGIKKKVDYEGVSENYYDSRNESGNASILAEYNELKKIAYNRSLKYPDSMPILDQDKFEDFSFSSSDAAKIKNSQALEKALNDTFKDDKITFDIDKDGYVTALDKNKEAAEFTMTVVDGNTLGIQKANAANRFSEKTTLKSLGLAADADGKYTMEINGAAISVDKDATIGSLLKAINASDAGVTAKFSTFTNGFEIFANDMGTGGDVLVKSSALTKALGLTSTDNGSTDKNDMVGYVDGKNTILKIGDQTVYHNSNSYTIDGTTINFADADLTSGSVSIHIGITKDNTDIKQSIKDFVKDYNQLVDDVFEHIATAPQRDSKNNKYEPLTDSEKDEIKELVLSAAGVDYARGDVISVSGLQFEGAAIDKLATEEMSKQYQKEQTIYMLTSSVIPLIVVLVLGSFALFILKGFKEQTITELNETIMAAPEDAAKLLTSYIRE